MESIWGCIAHTLSLLVLRQPHRGALYPIHMHLNYFETSLARCGESRLADLISGSPLVIDCDVLCFIK